MGRVGPVLRTQAALACMAPATGRASAGDDALPLVPALQRQAQLVNDAEGLVTRRQAAVKLATTRLTGIKPSARQRRSMGEQLAAKPSERTMTLRGLPVFVTRTALRRTCRLEHGRLNHA